MGLATVREMALNQVVRIPAVRRRARAGHSTGVLADPQRGREVFDRLAAMVPGGLGGADVLELGPGKGTGLMRPWSERGLGSYAAFDVTAYLDPAEVDALAIDYRIDPTGRLPWPDATFDLVWSYSVLEHTRDPRATVAEVVRVLRPGGVHVALIDFQDHYRDRRDPEQMYDMLRYRERTWNLMVGHRSSWTNRLRFSHWRTLLADAGLEPVAEHTVDCRFPVEDFRHLAYLDAVADEDLLVKEATFVGRRPAAP